MTRYCRRSRDRYAWLRGEHSAFTSLVVALSPRFFVGTRLGANPAPLREVVHRLGSWRSIAPDVRRTVFAQTWLFGIVINVARSHVEHKSAPFPVRARRRRGIEGPTVEPDLFSRWRMGGPLVSWPTPVSEPAYGLERDACAPCSNGRSRFAPLQQQVMVLLRRGGAQRRGNL